VLQAVVALETTKTQNSISLSIQFAYSQYFMEIKEALVVA